MQITMDKVMHKNLKRRATSMPRYTVCYSHSPSPFAPAARFQEIDDYVASAAQKKRINAALVFFCYFVNKVMNKLML